MISYDEALARVIEAARPLGRERIPIGEAQGRILARPVTAQIASPRSDVSAMDGYAVRECDLPRARVVGAAYPGAPHARPLGPGECVRIFTGGAVPDGADRVIVQEIVRRDGDHIQVAAEWSNARHIRPRGSDFVAGDILLPAGRRLDARAMVAAAGADLAELEVWRRPRVAILGTGDELVPPGTAGATRAGIPESLTFGIAAFVAERGGLVVSRGIAADDLQGLRSAAAAALSRANLVVMTGGASVGEKDYAKAAFPGLALLFDKVAMKPGKPVWFGRVGEGLVLGLPGNPTSAMVTARLLLAPLLAGLSGRDAAATISWRPAELAASLGACGDRETFVRGGRDQQAVRPLSNQDSGGQAALVDADYLIRQPAGTPAQAAGEIVSVIDF